MSKEPKYRPYLTLAQIQALAQAAEYCSDNNCLTETMELKPAINNLKMLLLKIDMDAVSPAFVPTGGKPGRASAVEILKKDAEDDLAKQVREMPYPQAVEAAKTYKSLGMEVPANIQAILDAGYMHSVVTKEGED